MSRRVIAYLSGKTGSVNLGLNRQDIDSLYSTFARQTLVVCDAAYSPYAGISVNPARR
jgi:hypothetical protein